jgi:hypothetical protein
MMGVELNIWMMMTPPPLDIFVVLRVLQPAIPFFADAALVLPSYSDQSFQRSVHRPQMHMQSPKYFGS